MINFLVGVVLFFLGYSQGYSYAIQNMQKIKIKKN